MRCKFCGAEIPDGTNFCPNCGKDLSKLRRCVKCGEMIDDDATFCPFCGTQQPRQQQAQAEQTEQDKQPMSQRPIQQSLNQSAQPMRDTPTYEEHTDSNNKWLWIVVAAVVAVIAIGGVYYFMEVRPSKTVAVAGDGNSASPDSTTSVEESESTTPAEERQEVEEKPVEEVKPVEEEEKPEVESKVVDEEEVKPEVKSRVVEEEEEKPEVKPKKEEEKHEDTEERKQALKDLSDSIEAEFESGDISRQQMVDEINQRLGTKKRLNNWSDEQQIC